MEPEVMMVSKRNLLFQGSILRFHVNFQFRGFESSILQVNVTCYHVFLDGRKCHQRKIMIRYHEVDRWNINLPQKKIRQPLTFPTLHLTLFKKKKTWNKNPAEKKTSSPFGRRRQTSPLHQRNWSAWQRRAASAGLNQVHQRVGSLDVPPIPTGAP